MDPEEDSCKLSVNITMGEDLEHDQSLSFNSDQTDSGTISLQVLEFKSCLLKAVEELHINREAEAHHEMQISKLMVEKQELEWYKESLQHKLDTISSHQEEVLANLKEQFQMKVRGAAEEKGVHQLTAELKDKEISNLKEELKLLQLSKYSLEKKLNKMEQKLQLHCQSRDNHLKQLGEVERRFGALSRQNTVIKQAHHELELNVDDAMRLNRRLTLVNEKQETTIMTLKKELVKLEHKLIETIVSSRGRSTESSRYAALQQYTQQLQHRLLMEIEINKKLKEDSETQRADKQEAMNSLQHAHKLLLSQTQAVGRRELKLPAHQEYHVLKGEQGVMLGRIESKEDSAVLSLGECSFSTMTCKEQCGSKMVAEGDHSDESKKRIQPVRNNISTLDVMEELRIQAVKMQDPTDGRAFLTDESSHSGSVALCCPLHSALQITSNSMQGPSFPTPGTGTEGPREFKNSSDIQKSCRPNSLVLAPSTRQESHQCSPLMSPQDTDTLSPNPIPAASMSNMETTGGSVPSQIHDSNNHTADPYRNESDLDLSSLIDSPHSSQRGLLTVGASSVYTVQSLSSLQNRSVYEATDGRNAPLASGDRERKKEENMHTEERKRDVHEGGIVLSASEEEMQCHISMAKDINRLANRPPHHIDLVEADEPLAAMEALSPAHTAAQTLRSTLTHSVGGTASLTVMNTEFKILSIDSPFNIAVMPQQNTETIPQQETTNIADLSTHLQSQLLHNNSQSSVSCPNSISNNDLIDINSQLSNPRSSAKTSKNECVSSGGDASLSLCVDSLALLDVLLPVSFKTGACKKAEPSTNTDNNQTVVEELPQSDNGKDARPLFKKDGKACVVTVVDLGPSVAVDSPLTEHSIKENGHSNCEEEQEISQQQQMTDSVDHPNNVIKSSDPITNLISKPTFVTDPLGKDLDLLSSNSFPTSAKREQEGDWKAIREAFKDNSAQEGSQPSFSAISPFLSSIDSRPWQQRPYILLSRSSPLKPTSSVLGWLQLYSQENQQQSSFRAQSSKNEQFLCSERLRLPKRGRTEDS